MASAYYEDFKNREDFLDEYYIENAHIRIVVRIANVAFFETNEKGEPIDDTACVQNEFDYYKCGGEEGLKKAVTTLGKTIKRYIEQQIEEDGEFKSFCGLRTACETAYTNALFHMVVSK